MDWKDSLSALKGTLPQGEAEPVVEEKVEEKVDSQNLIVSFEKKGRGGKTASKYLCSNSVKSLKSLHTIVFPFSSIFMPPY